MSDQNDGTLGIGAVAQRTGLTPDVLRVWERRHRAVSPDRSRGGTRFYRESDVRRLETLAKLVARGHRIGRIAPLETAELEALAETETETEKAPLTLSEPPEASPSAETSPPADWLPKAMAAVRSVDTAELDHQMTGLFLSMGARRFTLEVALPLLVRVGDLWAAQEISIAAEHAAVAILRSLLGGALRRRRGRESAQRAIFATPSGQRHEFGALAAALLAADQGVDAVFLGADLPCEDLILAAESTRAQAIVLGLPPCRLEGEAGDYAESFVSTLEQALPKDIVIGVGGDVNFELMRDLGVLVFGSLLAFDEAVFRYGRVPSASMLGMLTPSDWRVVDGAA